MDIFLDDEVLSYMDSKGQDSIMLYMRRSGGGWCGVIEAPEVELRVPAALEEYNVHQVNGKNVYVHKRVKAKNSGLKFYIRKVFFIKTVVVEGLINKVL